MDPPAPVPEPFNPYGIFSYLAYLLLLVLLYYLFLYLLEKHVKRLQNKTRRKGVAAVISILVDIAVALITFPFIYTAITLIAAVVVALLVIFILLAVVLGLLGLELPPLLKRLREKLQNR